MRGFATTFVASLALLAAAGCDMDAYDPPTVDDRQEERTPPAQEQEQEDPLGMDRPFEQEPETGMEQLEERPETATASGTVTSVDLTASSFTVEDAEGDTSTIYATPDVVADLQEDQQVTKNVTLYDDQAWVTPDEPEAFREAYPETATVTGTVENFDVQGGTITVEGQEIRIHPSELVDMREQSMVSIEVSEINEERWATEIEITAEGPIGAL